MDAALKRPFVGFLVSILLTLAAFAAVAGHLLPGGALLPAIFALAVAQLAVQMLFFLDLGFGAGSLWRTATFVATLGLVLVIVGGSLWIMTHLNYDMMASTDAMMKYIQGQQGF